MTALAFVLFALPLAAEPPVVIRNGTVLTVTKGTFVGSVVIRGGRIAEAGEKVMVPPGATVIDATGQFVMPGIIDCHSHLAAESINESGTAVSSMTDIAEVFNPRQVSIYRALAGGVTTVHVLHGSANPIGGKNLVVKTRWGRDAEGMRFEGAPPGLKLALGENVKRPGASPLAVNPRYPATRMGVEDVIRDALVRAQAYRKSWQDYEARRKRGEPAVPPRRDLQLEPLAEVIEGKRYVHAHCYRADEILMLMCVAEEFGFRIRTLQHALEGYKVAREIAAHGAGASTFSDWWGYKMEAIDAIPYNAALMARKGVLVSLNSDDEELMRRLNTEAAKAMKYGGLNETEALALITINPARQLGIDSRVGSIESGKDADIVIYDRHPLSNYAKVHKVLIDGRVYFDRDTDMSERPAREARKKALIEKLKPRERTASPAGTVPPGRRPQ